MEVLKRQFDMDVIVTQVERHFMLYKERWNSIARALNNSGNGFDEKRSMLTLSESEKSRLKDTERRLFARPIKYFSEMKEFFSKNTADGSLAKDVFSCLAGKGESDDSDENDMSTYAAPEDELAADSDTLSIGGDNTSSSYSRSKHSLEKVDHNSNSFCSRVKRRMGKTDQCSGSSKKGGKQSQMRKSADAICTTLQALQVALTAPPPPPRDPHATLWERLEAMTITTDQKLEVGTFLATNDNKGLLGFLCSSGEKTFQTWVFKFLSDEM